VANAAVSDVDLNVARPGLTALDFNRLERLVGRVGAIGLHRLVAGFVRFGVRKGCIS
jgi:hypothetical protein